MDAALAGLVGTSIGAVTGLLGGLVAGRQQLRVERDRWRQSRLDSIAASERAALVDVTALLAEGSQAAAWLGWAAGVKAAPEMEAEVREYDQRMRVLMPKLVSAEALASGLSDDAFERVLHPLVQRLMTLDSHLGDAYVGMASDSDAGLRRLQELKPEAVDLTEDIVANVRKMLRAETPA